MVNLGYLKTTDSLQEVARGMSAGVLLDGKLTRHNKAGAYQTLTVQFKLIPADAKLPLDKLLITEAWAKENHLLTQGSSPARRRRSPEKMRSAVIKCDF